VPYGGTRDAQGKMCRAKVASVIREVGSRALGSRETQRDLARFSNACKPLSINKGPQIFFSSYFRSAWLSVSWVKMRERKQTLLLLASRTWVPLHMPPSHSLKGKKGHSRQKQLLARREAINTPIL
jgi:hypothetical protein